MVDKFPYEISADVAKGPVLKGRANLQMVIRTRNNPNLPTITFDLVVDGYNAPVTAGNFVDLAQRKFYDGMEIQRGELVHLSSICLLRKMQHWRHKGYFVSTVSVRFYLPRPPTHQLFFLLLPHHHSPCHMRSQVPHTWFPLYFFIPHHAVPSCQLMALLCRRATPATKRLALLRRRQARSVASLWRSSCRVTRSPRTTRHWR